MISSFLRRWPVALLLGVFACASPSTPNSSVWFPPPPLPTVAKMVLTPATLKVNLASGETKSISVQVTPSDGLDTSLTWTSDNPAVADVDNFGVVTAKALGTANVTATANNGGLSASVSVDVFSLSLTTFAWTVPENYTAKTLQYTFKSPSGSTVVTGGPVWSASNAGSASVNGSGTVTFGSAGASTITCTVQDNSTVPVSYSATCAVKVFSRTNPGMTVGLNLWNLGWGNTYHDYVQAPLDVDNASWAGQTPGVTNPWHPRFLTDLGAVNGTVRFMDAGATNDLPIINFSDYITPQTNFVTGKSYPVADAIKQYFGGSTSPVNKSTMAYEWMIDICNRTGRDMWVNIPTFADDPAYWTSLATLINNTLDSNLRCYVEYSNETWNGSFKAFQYTIDKGVAAGIPGTNQYYQGGAYSVYRSLGIFKAFSDVFGSTVLPGTSIKRLVRVLAASGNYDVAIQGIKNVVYNGKVPGTAGWALNPTWNTGNQVPDFFAIAPYIGSELNGASSSILSEYRAATADVLTNRVNALITALAPYNYPAGSLVVGTYEGGQHLLNNAAGFNRNQVFYSEYTSMLDSWQTAGLVLFNQYTLYSTFNSGGAWGAKETAFKTDAESPKFRAIKDWVNAHYND